MLSRISKTILLGSCAALLGWLVPVVLPTAASAQPKAEAKPGALYVVTYIDVFPNFTDDTLKALRQFATDSRKDHGSMRFEFLQDVVRTNHFSVVEIWTNKKLLEGHQALPGVVQLKQRQPPRRSVFDAEDGVLGQAMAQAAGMNTEACGEFADRQ